MAFVIDEEDETNDVGVTSGFVPAPKDRALSVDILPKTS